jgi:hypothetical protein
LAIKNVQPLNFIADPVAAVAVLLEDGPGGQGEIVRRGGRGGTF